MIFTIPWPPPAPTHPPLRTWKRRTRRNKRTRQIERELVAAFEEALARDAWAESRRTEPAR